MTQKIAVIAGDGIGKEVVPAAIEVVEAAARRFDLDLAWTEFDWSCERLARSGELMPADGVEQMKPFDAIFLGAVGFPGVPDHVSLWSLLIPLRRGLDQYANVRPVRLLPGVTSPLRDRGPEDRAPRERVAVRHVFPPSLCRSGFRSSLGPQRARRRLRPKVNMRASTSTAPFTKSCV